MLSNLHIKKAKNPKLQIHKIHYTETSENFLKTKKKKKKEEERKVLKAMREIWYFSYKEKNNPEFPPQTTEPKEVTQPKTWTLYMK